MELMYKEERDREFYNICERIRKGKSISISEIVAIAINEPCSSFFLSKKGIWRILLYEGCMTGVKGELYSKIKEIYNGLGDVNKSTACDIIEHLPAPRFYMSHSRAVSLYYELINNKNFKK